MKINALHEAVRGLGHDAEYMSDDMIALFKDNLLAEVPIIKSRISELEVIFKERGADKFTDHADIAQQQSELNDTLFEKRKCEERLRKISEALKNIELGDYGYCIDCGEEIGVGRMCADTTNLRDASCATTHEQKQSKLFGRKATFALA